MHVGIISIWQLGLDLHYKGFLQVAHCGYHQLGAAQVPAALPLQSVEIRWILCGIHEEKLVGKVINYCGMFYICGRDAEICTDESRNCCNC